MYMYGITYNIDSYYHAAVNDLWNMLQQWSLLSTNLEGGTQNHYYHRYLLSGLVYVHEVYAQGQDEEYLLYPGVCTKPCRYLLSGLDYVREVYTGTE